MQNGSAFSSPFAHRPSHCSLVHSPPLPVGKIAANTVHTRYGRGRIIHEFRHLEDIGHLGEVDNTRHNGAAELGLLVEGQLALREEVAGVGVARLACQVDGLL